MMNINDDYAYQLPLSYDDDDDQNDSSANLRNDNDDEEDCSAGDAAIAFAEEIRRLSAALNDEEETKTDELAEDSCDVDAVFFKIKSAFNISLR